MPALPPSRAGTPFGAADGAAAPCAAAGTLAVDRAGPAAAAVGGAEDAEAAATAAA